ncbi:MAG: hypothetical protein A2042_05085 [Candidatus Schekmanbacteria bacterium GWA2_38_11]|uniref:histidine kinase n=1 Tax=Candidatus Schekmanbacteria bacterium GWA2_38_11 TaxID=1817876 RepID=A0A1F7RJ55_9BACT|nr:MAG: hypothetical protein A2042_05085 [Candidatus Schekmanbacteria bacterium GWA2_38_11]
MSLRKKYLDNVIEFVRSLSGCQCAGIRILNEEGGIPYESYSGFSREFWESENCLSVKKDQCACIRIITGQPEPQDLNAMTQGGSFLCNNLGNFVNCLTEQEKTRFRGMCAQHGYASVAVIPVRYKNKIIGAIHLADKGADRISPKAIESIESLTRVIGDGIQKFDMEDTIRQSYIAGGVINSLLRLSLEDLDLEKLLDRTLDMLLSIPWLSPESMGSIFLVENTQDLLVMKTQKGFPEFLEKECAQVPFGSCFCGQAALKQQMQFTDQIDHEHEIRLKGVIPRGLYCIPIISSGRVLGVLNIYLGENYRRDQKKEEFLTTIANSLAGIIHRKQTEKKLSETNELLETIFSDTHLLIAYMDKNFNFIRVNRAYAQADGLAPEFFAGRNYFDLYPDDDNKLIFNRVVKTGDPYSTHGKPFIYTQHPERGITYWDWSLHPVKNSSGMVETVILCLVNVTERKLAEMELMQAQKDLESARRLSDIGTLASVIAHELRNPLSAIRIAAYNIKRKGQLTSLEKHFATIEKKIVESDQIINNLLFYSRLKMPHYQTFRVYEILNECIASAKKRFSEETISVDKKIDSIKKDYIEADPLQIGELFNNILNNAFEALSNRKGKIAIAAGKDDKDKIEIIFRDNGVGIEEEDLKRIFEPFFTKKSKGTGLGLTVCNQVVNLHSGKIEIESKKDRGTTFTVILPMKKKKVEKL